MEQEKNKRIEFKNLPDTIGVKEYMSWRNCGRKTADEVFHSKNFPRLPHTGNRLMADKYAVLAYELGISMNLNMEDTQQLLISIIKDKSKTQNLQEDEEFEV